MSGITDFSMAFHPRLKYPEHCDEEIPFPPPSSLILRNDVCLLCNTRTRGSSNGKTDLRRVGRRCSSPVPHPAGLQGLGRLRQRHPSDESAEVEGEGAWPGKDLQMTEPSSSARQGRRHPASSFGFYGGMSRGLDYFYCCFLNTDVNCEHRQNRRSL